MLTISEEGKVTGREGRWILVYLDGSEDSRKVVEAAAQIAKEEGCILALVTVVRRNHRIPDDFRKYVESERLVDPPQYVYYRLVGEGVLAPYRDILQEQGVPYEIFVEVGDKRERIESLAKTLRPHKIIMSLNGMKGRSPLHFFRRAATLDVDCPVTIIP